MSQSAPRRLWLLLAVSVGLNLLLIGFVGARLWFGPPIDSLRPGLAPGASTAGLMWMIRSLPEARRDELRPSIREAMRGSRPAFISIRRQHRAVEQALLAEPFSNEDLAAALAGLRTTVADSEARAHAALAHLAGELTAAERQQLAEALRQPPRGRREHRRGGGHREERRARREAHDGPVHKQPAETP